MTPTQVSIFLTRSTGRIGQIIARGSAPMFCGKDKRLHVATHGGLKIDFGDSQKSMVAEGHCDSDWSVTPWQHILDKHHADEERRLWIYPLEFAPEELVEIWERCERQVGLWDYDTKQLLRIYFWRLTQRKIGVKKTQAIDCTEAVSRILRPYLDLRQVAGVKKHDTVTPYNLQKGLNEKGYLCEEIPFDPLDNIGQA